MRLISVNRMVLCYIGEKQTNHLACAPLRGGARFAKAQTLKEKE